jgi:hypothetical protein
MSERPPDGPIIPEDKLELPEAAYGGADAVEKTTYVTGSGTDPEAVKPPGVPVARVPPGGGQGATWAIIIFLAVGAALVYLSGFGR